MATEWSWHRPIFPGLDDPSIVGAGAFHCRVRHGNGWDHSALATRTNRSPREPRVAPKEIVEQTDEIVGISSGRRAPVSPEGSLLRAWILPTR